MKDKKTDFIPLGHDNLDIKNELITYARTLKGKPEFENQLAASFIYVSFAEYLAKNLLENLRHFVYQGTYDQFAGIIHIDQRDEKTNKPLGFLLGEIDKYDFPDKHGIRTLLSRILMLRNNLFHNFAMADLAELERIVLDDLKELQDKTEDLIKKINTVYGGLGKILIPKYTTPEKTEDTKEPKEAKELEKTEEPEKDK